MKRFSDWTRRLDAFLQENWDRPFEYGSWDCCLFVAGAVQAMTGIDVAAPFRGKYGDAAGADAIITQHGTIADLAASVFENHWLVEVSPLRAQRGDVAVVRQAHDSMLGLVALDGIHVLIVGREADTAREGIGRLPLSSAVRAWRV